MSVYYQEIEWRKRASQELAQPLADYTLFLRDSIGLRLRKNSKRNRPLQFPHASLLMKIFPCSSDLPL
ncbi:MAG: hypothetical protein Ct9H300mP28_09920 [Pseudomonadota bacterium]|nr:MAG: hypothetical protein Ct9H300mP28_09920 [Pseudomonadota bacterium]